MNPNTVLRHQCAHPSPFLSSLLVPCAQEGLGLGPPLSCSPAARPALGKMSALPTFSSATWEMSRAWHVSAGDRPGMESACFFSFSRSPARPDPSLGTLPRVADLSPCCCRPPPPASHTPATQAPCGLCASWAPAPLSASRSASGLAPAQTLQIAETRTGHTCHSYQGVTSVFPGSAAWGEGDDITRLHSTSQRGPSVHLPWGHIRPPTSPLLPQ